MRISDWSSDVCSSDLAMGAVAAHYMSLFGNDPSTHDLREGYAMRENTVADMEHRREVTAFFWWTSWAAATQRPNEPMSYTQHWPYEPLAGNTPTSTSFLWSVFSIRFMIFGIGLLGWHHARQVSHEIGRRAGRARGGEDG